MLIAYIYKTIVKSLFKKKLMIMNFFFFFIACASLFCVKTLSAIHFKNICRNVYIDNSIYGFN